MNQVPTEGPDTPPVVRTADARFANLPGYEFASKYHDVANPLGGGALRMHYIDEGPRDAPVVLLAHGEPSWSYVYRKLIPILAAAGLRAVAPDHIGFGRSDKLTRSADYSFERHVGWLSEFVDGLDLRDITLVCQDWGRPAGARRLGTIGGSFRSCRRREHDAAHRRGGPCGPNRGCEPRSQRPRSDRGVLSTELDVP